MIQGRDGLCFLLETLFAGWVGAEFRRQQLERDFAIQAGIASPVHLSHAPRTEWRDDFVGPNLLWRLCHSLPVTVLKDGV
jgi:hypothetical protein